MGAKFIRPVPKCQFGTYKTSTGLVGLAVDPNGDETLKSLSSQVLTSVQVIITLYFIITSIQFIFANLFNLFITENSS